MVPRARQACRYAERRGKPGSGYLPSAQEPPTTSIRPEGITVEREGVTRSA